MKQADDDKKISAIESKWRGWLASKARRAVVYLDPAMAECLQWNGGLGLLFRAGAVAVKAFSQPGPDSESNGTTSKKALFVVRGPLTGACRETLKSIISANEYEYCLITTAASAALHRYLKTKGAHTAAPSGQPLDAFRRELNATVVEEMEMFILQWMKNPNSTVEICPEPLLSMIRPISDVVLLPTCGGLGLLSSSPSNRVLLRHVASSLAHLCASVVGSPAVQPEVFYSVGSYLAESVTKEFLSAAAEEALWPPGPLARRGGKRISLVLMDRAADLVGPTGHWSGSVAEKAFASSEFPHLPGHSSDLAIEMSAGFPGGENEWTRGLMFPGCLSDISMENAALLKSAFLDNPRRCFTRISNKLNQDKDLIDEAMQFSEPLVQQLHSVANEDAGLLQLCVLVDAVESGSPKDREAVEDSKVLQLSSLEKMLTQLGPGADDDADDDVAERILIEIEKLVKERHTRGLNLDDILGLLTFSASMFGVSTLPIFTATERSATNNTTGEVGSREGSPCASDVETILVDAIWEEQENLPALCRSIVGELIDEMSVREAARNIASVLASVASRREKWSSALSELVRRPDPMIPGEYRSLLAQIVDSIVKPVKSEIPDLIHRPSEEEGIRDLLKTGLGFLMKSKKSYHPGDAEIIIIVVLGGLTAQEIRVVRHIVEAKTDKQVILCGTRLLKPRDTLEELFLQD